MLGVGAMSSTNWTPVSLPTHPVTFAPRGRCPYCRGNRVVVETDGDGFRVSCECGACGGREENLVFAITHWNNVSRAVLNAHA
jgi:hypothetical protein